MTAGRHVEDLFSAAYDGELAGADGRAFGDHLARCAGCSTAYARFRVAVDALRSLPMAAMPDDVRLPAGPPEAQQEAGIRPLIRNTGRARSWAWGLSAAGVAAAVVLAAGLALRGGGSAPPASVHSPAPAAAAVAPSGAVPLRAAVGAAGSSCAQPAPASPGGVPAAAAPAASPPSAPDRAAPQAVAAPAARSASPSPTTACTSSGNR